MSNPIRYNSDGFPETIMVSAPIHQPRSARPLRSSHADSSHRSVHRITDTLLVIMGSVVAALILAGII